MTVYMFSIFVWDGDFCDATSYVIPENDVEDLSVILSRISWPLAKTNFLNWSTRSWARNTSSRGSRIILSDCRHNKNFK